MKTKLAGPTLRVLHLEDNRNDADLVEATLRAEGLRPEITRVETRQAFDDALRAGGFDVILADYNLPSFDGLSAQTAAAALRPDVPFIFLSGSIGEDEAIERVKAGATDYVLKERMGRLAAAVRRALAEAAERAERQRADDEIRRLNAELEQRVIDRTLALEAAQRAAERANRAKSEFLSRMSHDLRTPLNAILGFAQLLAGEDLDGERLEYVRQILNGGKHLLELINEVLDIARIEAGHLSLSPEPVNVADSARQVLELVTPLATERGITLSLSDHGCSELSVLADRQRLAQILMNLVSNAVKYNRNGGRVVVECAARPQRRLRISVVDTGAGIAPDKLQLLFNPFQRLGAELTATEGTGLGLALSQGLAHAMGGTMGVESEVDKGSRFWVELALSDETAAVRRIEAPVHAVTHEGLTGTILYIEDNVSNVRLMERIFRRRPGVTLLHAARGSAGVAMARQHRPAAIFLDLHLPDMSGEEVLRQLWEDPQLRTIPVAVLSADATSGQMRRLKASGAAAYLTKPLDINRVVELADEFLSGQVKPDSHAGEEA